jgi:hypothetical protein
MRTLNSPYMRIIRTLIVSGSKPVMKKADPMEWSKQQVTMDLLGSPATGYEYASLVHGPICPFVQHLSSSIRADG